MDEIDVLMKLIYFGNKITACNYYLWHADHLGAFAYHGIPLDGC